MRLCECVSPDKMDYLPDGQEFYRCSACSGLFTEEMAIEKAEMLKDMDLAISANS